MNNSSAYIGPRPKSKSTDAVFSYSKEFVEVSDIVIKLKRFVTAPAIRLRLMALLWFNFLFDFQRGDCCSGRPCCS